MLSSHFESAGHRFNSLAYAFNCTIVALALLTLGACTTTNPSVGKFNNKAYENATSIKARALALVDLSAEPYTKHEQTAVTLMTDVSAAREFSAGLPNNSISAAQWDAIRDPQRNLLGGYIGKWKARTGAGMAEFFRKEVKTQLSRAFDYLICLEANKGAAKPCSNLAPAT